MKIINSRWTRREFIRFSITAMLQAMFFSWTSSARAVANSCSRLDWEKQILTSPQFKEGRFVNPVNAPVIAEGSTLPYIKKRFFTTRIDPAPAGELPVRKIKKEEWVSIRENELQFAWLGHSSTLITMDEKLILVDPVFEERASPFSWIGPRRFHPAPVAVDELPKIDVVLITHDHYDHLEEPTIRQLKDQTDFFVVPLGIGGLLSDWGVPSNKIVVLDWWEAHKIDSLNITATPAVHYARRGLFDGDKRLWCSFAVHGREKKVFISGDSGYFDGFKKIGDQLGPFDATFLKIGSYDEMWKQIHMLPEQAVQQHIDLGGHILVPLHWATFDLALHPWYEPVERMMAAAREKNVKFITPFIGEHIDLNRITDTPQWWKSS